MQQATGPRYREQLLPLFEDAPTGIEAARRAGMHVIAVPSVFELDHPGICAADRVLASLTDFRLHMISL